VCHKGEPHVETSEILVGCWAGAFKRVAS
jgi:hypothetical protein